MKFYGIILLVTFKSSACFHISCSVGRFIMIGALKY